MKPIVPSVITGVNLSMLDMSQDDKFVDVITQLGLLCDKYEEWIATLERRRRTFDRDLLSTADRHIINCKKCLKRMKKV